MGLGGKEEQNVTSFGTYLAAVDYKTGKPKWKHHFPGSGWWGGTYIGHAYLTTAGGLLFGGDPGGNIVAYDAKDGSPLWHVRLGEVSNAPETFLIDGKQHLLVGSVDTLYMFALPD
jgi:alcohol dehydrogenase (cytochrome c)